MQHHPHVDDWRRLGLRERLDFLRWVQDIESIRQNTGHEEHGDTFIGDPLIHAAQEMADGLFYIYKAMKERAAARGDVDNSGKYYTPFDHPVVQLSYQIIEQEKR